MKVKFAVLSSLARQVEGEFVFQNIIEANVDPQILQKKIEEGSLPRTATIGGVGCVIEYGIIQDLELEVPEGETNG